MTWYLPFLAEILNQLGCNQKPLNSGMNYQPGKLLETGLVSRSTVGSLERDISTDYILKVAWYNCCKKHLHDHIEIHV